MTKQTLIQLVLMVSAATLFFILGHRIAATVLSVFAGLVLTLALVMPAPLQTLQELVRRAGAALGSGIGLVLLTLLYFSLFLPVSLGLRLFRVDVLNRNFPSSGKSNWIDRVGHGTDKRLYTKLYTRPHASDQSKPVMRPQAPERSKG
jgi:succinate dehydrogenase/fumarate reductase cytochrome b subunit